MTTQLASKRVSMENILFATDFSRHSNQALPFVLSIARKYGSTVSAVHVIPPSGLPPTMEVRAIAAQALREADEGMKAVSSRLQGIPHTLVVRKGDVGEELSAVVEQNGIDLIIVGTHGRAGASKLLMGSVSERIVRQSSCPVLTVGPNVSEEPEGVADIHTILYPTDFSSESMAALPYAVSLAQENQARLYLLHVMPASQADSFDDALGVRLRALVPPEAKLWCEPKVYVESGDAAEKILELAEELAVDLIVLGTKHVSRFAATRTHLGMATAYRVMIQALCPVLSVRG
ncbi:MAG TPA: universal stress protein [Candidatus Dormibacteraeota bacterium]|nr:universal stress protein [Candidatus Dormibacteraeota bacterium]